jgi:RNA polymerase sigma-70 factor (ECF subfamily)
LNGLETLVRQYQVQAVYAAYLIVRDLGLAEDIVQSAFLTAAQKIHQFDDSRPFRAWFLRSVINAAIKAAKQQSRLLPLEPAPDDEMASIQEWIIDPDPRPDQVVETEEIRQSVWRALADLSPEQRAAIVMRHFLEMNETEMMLELGRPLTTVRWWLRTARNRLRALLKPIWQIEHVEDDDEGQA